MADLIKKSGTLLLHHEVNDIIAKVSLTIREIPEYNSLKLNHDLCVYVLNLVMNMVQSKTLDIPTIVVAIMTKVFSLNEEETGLLNKQIEYLISSGAVKKVGFLKIAFKYLKKKVYKIIRTGVQNFICNKVQNIIVPYNIYTNIPQLVIYYSLTKFGMNASIVALILLFL